MLLNKLLYAILLCVMFDVSAQTNDSVVVLEETILTATRVERKVVNLPLPYTLITQEGISKSGSTKLNEILAEQTGLLTIPTFGGVEGIQIQGLDAAYTLILVDGLPLVGRSAGTLDLSRVSVGNIDKIEILKGASSSLYGSEALAGVINIITQKPENENVSGQFSNRYATFNTTDFNSTINLKKNKLATSLFFNLFNTDGFDLDTTTEVKTIEPYYNLTVQPKLFYTFSDKLDIVSSLRYFNQIQDYKAVINSELLEGKGTINEFNSQLKLNQKWNALFKTEYEVYLTNYKTDEVLNEANESIFEQNYYNQWLFRPEIRTNFSSNNYSITTGIGYNQESLNRTDFDNAIQFNSYYLFTQLDYNPTKKVNILVGFRYDNHNQYKSQLSPKLALNYSISENLSLKSSAGYGFKAPDFRQLYFDFTNPSVGYTVLGYNVAENKLSELENQGQLLYRTQNSNFTNPLRPESSINLNFGSAYKKNKLQIDANFFYNLISNLIDTQVIAQKTNGQNVFSYFNINKIFTYGLEYNLNYKLNKNLNFSVGYQYLEAKDKAVIDAIKNKQVFVRDSQTLETIALKKDAYFGLFNRSKHTFNTKISYTLPDLKTAFNLRVFYRSKFGLMDTNNNQILDKYDDFVANYFIANLSITKTILEKYTLQIGANNLFNFTNPDAISNLSGRQIFGRIQYQF